MRLRRCDIPNGVVYTASVGLGIDHKFGTSTTSNIFFNNVNIEALQVNSGGQAAWLALFVEIAGEGVGPVKDIFVRNIRVREQGTRNGLVQGFNLSAMVSEVTLSNMYYPSP